MRMDAYLKFASGIGVVSSFILMSDDRDEIDVEYLGKNVTDILSNYYYRGIEDWSKGETHR